MKIKQIHAKTKKRAVLQLHSKTTRSSTTQIHPSDFENQRDTRSIYNRNAIFFYYSIAQTNVLSDAIAGRSYTTDTHAHTHTFLNRHCEVNVNPFQIDNKFAIFSFFAYRLYLELQIDRSEIFGYFLLVVFFCVFLFFVVLLSNWFGQKLERRAIAEMK